MELEESGLDTANFDVGLLDEDNLGFVEFSDPTEAQISQAIFTINQMDDYEVVEG